MQEIFYLYKNEMEDGITDDELLHLMKEQFELICFGDLEYLESTCLANFSQAVRVCLRDTFMKGLPDFFKWYDIRFEPQNTILTLDYPVLKDISSYAGIDKIYEFIRCVHAEQKLLKRFPKNYVITVLASYNGQYKEMVENHCCASKHAEFERIKEYQNEYASKQTDIRRTI